jgi:hypothetical protein
MTRWSMQRDSVSKLSDLPNLDPTQFKRPAPEDFEAVTTSTYPPTDFVPVWVTPAALLQPSFDLRGVKARLRWFGKLSLQLATSVIGMRPFSGRDRRHGFIKDAFSSHGKAIQAVIRLI